MKTATDLSALVKERAQELGFNLVGISSVDERYPEGDFFEHWIRSGYAGEMGYLKKGALKRKEIRRVLPSARSVISCALNYNTEHPLSTEVSNNSSGWIARYAWGDDYHDVIKAMLDDLAGYVKSICQQNADTKVYVDTGPVLEKTHAARSGVGWIGKNTCLINQKVGSWFFLGEIITDLELAGDTPVTDRCGSCRRCIDACPTDAIVRPYVLDATKCISYLTIELKGKIPERLRSGIENNVFGCDVCQDVCPWNRRAAFTLKEQFLPREKFLAPEFSWLLSLDEEEFRNVFRKSPVKRSKRRGFMRNVLVAVGNSGNKEYIKYVKDLLRDKEPLIRSHAVWALWKLCGDQCLDDLQNLLACETDTDVLNEIHYVIDTVGS